MSADAATSPSSELAEVCDWIRGEFLELPGLCLTRAQVQRRWNLNGATSEAVLSRLVKNGVLRKTVVGYKLSSGMMAALQHAR